jgi:hypothetical protein
VVTIVIDEVARDFDGARVDAGIVRLAVRFVATVQIAVLRVPPVTVLVRAVAGDVLLARIQAGVVGGAVAVVGVPVTVPVVVVEVYQVYGRVGVVAIMAIPAVAINRWSAMLPISPVTPSVPSQRPLVVSYSLHLSTCENHPDSPNASKFPPGMPTMERAARVSPEVE